MKPDPSKTAKWCAVSAFAFGMTLVALDKADHPATGLLFIFWAIFAAASLIIDAMRMLRPASADTDGGQR